MKKKKKKKTLNMIWTQSQSEKYEKQNEEAKTEDRSQHMFGQAGMGVSHSHLQRLEVFHTIYRFSKIQN